MHKIQSNLQTDQNSIFRTNTRRRNGVKNKKWPTTAMPSVCLTHHEHRETERLGTEHSWKCQPHLDLPSGSYQSLRNVPYNQWLPCNCINNCRHLHSREFLYIQWECSGCGPSASVRRAQEQHRASDRRHSSCIPEQADWTGLAWSNRPQQEHTQTENSKRVLLKNIQQTTGII